MVDKINFISKKYSAKIIFVFSIVLISSIIGCEDANVHEDPLCYNCVPPQNDQQVNQDLCDEDLKQQLENKGWTCQIN